MNPYSLPPLISSIIFLIFGFIVYFRSNKDLETRLAFFLNCFVTFIWQFTFFINFNTHNEYLNRYFVYQAYLGISFIPATFFHFFCCYLNFKTRFKFIYYLIAIFFNFLLLSNSYIDGYYNYFWGPYPKAGNLHFLFLIYIIILVLHTVLIMIRHGKKDSWKGQRADQIKFLILYILIYALSSIDFIPNYGIEFYPVGFLFILIAVSLMIYALIKYKLLDVNIFIEKSVMYSSSIAFISLIYLLLVFILENLFRHIFSYSSFTISGFVAFFLGIAFFPVRNILQTIIDQNFFHGTPIQIAQENKLLRQEIADKEKFKAIATLASGMAHEIKNPLTAIKTFAEYLPQKKNDPEFLHKFSEIVGREVDRIDDTIHQLLEFAKPSPLTLKHTDLNKLIDNTLSLLNNQLISKKIEAKFIHYDEPLMIKLDPNQMRQVFLNLFLNAIDAMPNGGTLTVGVRAQGIGDSKQKISNPLTLTPKPSNVEITIQDTGVGIAPEDIKHIFDPFFSKKADGTGLGLAICYQIITEHSGNITVVSKIDSGTTLKITLPNP